MQFVGYQQDHLADVTRLRGRQRYSLFEFDLGRISGEYLRLSVADLRKLFAAWKQDVSKDATVQPDRPVELR